MYILLNIYFEGTFKYHFTETNKSSFYRFLEKNHKTNNERRIGTDLNEKVTIWENLLLTIGTNLPKIVKNYTKCPQVLRLHSLFRKYFCFVITIKHN